MQRLQQCPVTKTSKCGAWILEIVIDLFSHIQSSSLAYVMSLELTISGRLVPAEI